MAQPKIPIHNFATDDAKSIPFKANPIRTTSRYNASVPHRHNYYECFFFEAGKGVHTIDFKDYELRENSVHFVSPGQVHQLKHEAGTRGHVVIFSREFYYTGSERKDFLFEFPFLNNSPNPVFYPAEDVFKELFGLVLKIENEFGNEPPEFDIIRSYLNVILLKSKRIFERDKQEISTQPNPLINSFRTMLEEKFAFQHLVKEYAADLAVSEKTLNETVKKTFGKTASEMIHERIILEAKRLLTHGDISVKEIAYALNFDDPAHFSKFFKTNAGIAPVNFKKQGF